KNLVFDACSLIYLTKISLKETILSLSNEIMIPTSVKEEVLVNIEASKDARIINANIKSGDIKEEKIKESIMFKNLGRGELEAIKLAETHNYILVTDDKLAINLGLNRGLKVKTTEILLFDLLKEKIISHKMFKEKLFELQKIKTLKPDVFQFLLMESDKWKCLNS
ncbi:MAG: hypothetical protein ACXQS8_07265, partial [Candidatus Helarchaeales archaeon]